MLKTKVKSFLVILSVMFCTCLFLTACKDENVKVERVKFLNSSEITLVVGESLTPEVEVAPSYASNKEYHFEIGVNSGVLEINEKEIKALKEGVAQLKVVSDENQYINDVISVKVIASPTTLSSPQNLTFDGTKFSFNSVSDANGYILNVNGRDIKLALKTSLTLDEYVSVTHEDPYNKVLAVKVKAYGDQRITLDSEYSEEIKIKKMGAPQNFAIQDSVLTFSKVEGVSDYKFSITNEAGVVRTITFSSSAFPGVTISQGVASYANFLAGGKYKCVLTDETSYEKTSGVEIFKFDPISLDLCVLGTPSDVVMSHYVLSWAKVQYADSYSIYDNEGQLIATDIQDTSFDLTNYISSLNETNFSVKVKALSSNSVNCLAGNKFSDLINFELLEKPTVTLDFVNSKINWQTVENAIGYRVTLKDLASENESEYVVSTLKSFDVSSLEAGEYSISITSCGDGKTYLNSLGGTEKQFSILSGVKNLKLENGVFSWDNQTGESYDVEIVGLDATKQNIPQNSYDISGLDLNAGDYRFLVGVIAHDNKFASKVESLSFMRLQDARNIQVSSTTNGAISFTIDSATVSTNVDLYKAGDKNNTISLTRENKFTYNFNLNDLEVGDYYIEVSCLGNNKTILDAKNTLSPFKITKLGVPGLTIDSVNSLIMLSDEVELSEGYELYENGIKVGNLSAVNKSYDLTSLSANSYNYQIKTLGNGSEIISSNLSAVLKKVVRLKTPEITFDKTQKTFSILTDEDSYISEFAFKLNNSSMTVSGKTVNCVDYFSSASAGDYVAIASLKAKAIEDLPTGIDFVLNSAQGSLTISKIDSSANLSLQNGRLIISPTKISDIDTSYRPRIKIGYKNEGDTEFSYLEYSNLILEDNKYSVKIMDENYNAIGPAVSNQPVFSIGTEFEIWFILDNTANSLIASNEVKLGTITKRDIVENVTKYGEKMSFGAVDGATSYKLCIETDAIYYIDVNSTSVNISEIKEKFLTAGLTIVDNVEYELGVVVVGDDATKVLSSINRDIFRFKILSTPTVTINENGQKAIKILNNVDGANKYFIKFTDQAGNIFSTSLTVEGDDVSYMLSEVTGLNSGEIDVLIHAENDGDVNYYNSADMTLSYQVLSAPVLTLADGILSWNNSENATSYLLEYYKNGRFETKTLVNGVDNFVLDDGVAKYDLVELDAGASKIKVKAISVFFNASVYYYDSPESLEQEVYKLHSPTASVESGNIVLAFDAGEVDLISKVEITRRSDNKVFNLLEFVDAISTKNIIVADQIMRYLSSAEIENEEFGIKVYAKDFKTCGEYVLNSNVSTENFKGLKQAMDLGIDTTIGADGNETIDTIEWTNNAQNIGHVLGYAVVINYNGKDYSYSVSGEDNCVLLFPNEEEFKAGAYKIKIMTLSKSIDNYVNSEYSLEYNFTVCETPNNVRTDSGIILWDSVSGAKNYLLRVYDKDATLIESVRLNKNRLDFNTLNGTYSEGLYKITIQAINENDVTIVSSEVTPSYSIVKLPKIEKYKLEMGELYVYAHSFTSKIELTFTNVTDTSVKSYFTMERTSSVSNLLTAENLTGWDDVNNLSDLLMSTDENDDHYMGYFKFVPKNSVVDGNSILDCLNTSYYLDIMAIGSTGERFMIVNSQLTHSNFEENLKNENVDLESALMKTQTPNMQVSTTTRGKVVWNLVDTSYGNMNYSGLEGKLIYEVNMMALGDNYNFYVFNEFDIRDIPDGAKLVSYKYPTLIREPSDWAENYANYYEYVAGQGYVLITGDSAPTFEANRYYRLNEDNKADYYGYLIYNDIVINIVAYTDNSVNQSELFIDFSKDSFTFVEKYLSDGNVVSHTLDLTEGGPFNASVNIVGDDTTYLTSNKSQTVKIKRYRELSLSIQDGELVFENLAKLDTSDSPIYLLTIKQNGEKLMLIYLYDKEASDNFTLPETISGATYIDAVSYADDQIHYALDLMKEDNTYLLASGTYQINLKTYYRDSSSFEMIQSKVSGDKDAIKLPTVDLSTLSSGSYLVDGKLSWKQLIVGTSEIAIENYEILIDDSTRIRVNKDDYKLEKGNISYSLKEVIKDVNGDDFSFDPTKNYTFKIFALAGENMAYINSNPCEAFSAGFTDSVTNVIKSQGRIEWDAWTQECVYEYVLSYPISSTEIVTYTNTTENNYFVLPETIVDDAGQERTLSSNYKYSFKVKRRGNDTLLSSFYVNILNDEQMERLKTVSASSIVTKEGVLTWEKIVNKDGQEVTDLTYYLNILYEDTTSEQISLETNSFDFATLKSGKMTITLSSKSDGYFNSMISEPVYIYKFGQIGDMSLGELDGIKCVLSWAPVSINGEYADIYYLDIDGKRETIVPSDITKTITVNLSEIEMYKNMDLVDGEFKCKVQARSSAEAGCYINGEWSIEKSFGKASMIDAKTLVVNGLYFEWNQISDENENSDSYFLEYDLIYTNLKGVLVTEHIKKELMANDTNAYYLSGEENTIKTYRYLPTIIGTYKNIRVTVNRTNAASSDSTIMKDGETNVVYTFYLYKSGAGTSENPYLISNITELKNVSKFNSSYFKLVENIDLESSTFEDAIISGEFKGVFDGDNKSITHFVITSTKNKLGLFESMSNAEVKNLNLSNLKAELTTTYSGKDIYLGVLTSSAVNSTISKISISYATTQIQISDDNSLSSGARSFYLGGLAGYIANTSITSCQVDLTGYKEEGELINKILISGCGNDYVYYGGFVGAMVNSSILGTLVEEDSYDASVTFKYIPTITMNNAGIFYYPYVYAGGVAGMMSQNSNIKYVKVEVSQIANPNYSSVMIYANGGFVGKAGTSDSDTNTIQNCKVDCCVENVGIGGGVSNVVNKSSIYLGKSVAIKNGNVLLLDNIANLVLDYSANLSIKVSDE